MKTMNTKEVVKFIKGGQCRLAEIIGIKQPSISYRVKMNIPISAEEAIKIDMANVGLSKNDIRPDIFGETQKEEVA